MLGERHSQSVYPRKLIFDGFHVLTHHLPINTSKTEAKPIIEPLDPHLREIPLIFLQLGQHILGIVQQLLPMHFLLFRRSGKLVYYSACRSSGTTYYRATLLRKCGIFACRCFHVLYLVMFSRSIPGNVLCEDPSRVKILYKKGSKQCNLLFS